MSLEGTIVPGELKLYLVPRIWISFLEFKLNVCSRKLMRFYSQLVTWQRFGNRQKMLKWKVFLNLRPFHFRWLNITGFDAAFRISIVILLNHLNWNGCKSITQTCSRFDTLSYLCCITYAFTLWRNKTKSDPLVLPFWS